MGTFVVSAVLLVAGALLVWLSWIASQRRLPPNRWAGIRLRSTTASDEAWYVAHEAAAGWLGVAGGVSALGGVAVGVLGLDSLPGTIAAAVALGGILVCVGVSTAQALAAVKRLDY